MRIFIDKTYQNKVIKNNHMKDYEIQEARCHFVVIHIAKKKKEV